MNQQNEVSQTQKDQDDKQIKVEDTQISISVRDQIAQQQKKPQQAHASISYRPYIDGLRTIAILTVVIFHAFPKFMTGGFIGVDVFFVISGYLISGIIIKQTRKEKFSYVDFYCRRIKRIYPALLLVLAFVLYFVPKYYGPSELEFTLKTLNAATVFGANFQVLVHEKGYFDSDIHTNPLLHLWSLGVEEQFYIFWPCLISVCLGKFKKHALFGLSFYTAVSFLFGIVSVFMNTKFAFYFPVCRFWQMAVGGLVSYLGVKIQNKNINEALSTAGTLSILVTVWILNDQSLFPGFWALIPTVAAACIIQAGSQPFINKHILSSKVFVFVGKISYPMYLWHWPLLVFSRYFYPEGSTSIFSNVYFILMITVSLSVMTYFFVENPIREIKTRKLVIVLLLLMVTGGIASFRNLGLARTNVNQYDKELLQSLIIKAERQIIPRYNQDFVERNGKMHPNLSKSSNRFSPTIESIRVANWDQFEDLANGGELILEKKIKEGSKYFIKDRPKLSNFQVANEGKQNQVFIVGDSHAMKISYRFQQLHRNSVAQNKTDSFPTIVSMIQRGTQLNETNQLLNLTRLMIKEHKPKRILFACHWIVYVVEDRQRPIPVYMEEKLKDLFKDFFAFVKQVQDLGVEVSVLTIDMHDVKYDARKMIDFNGIIEENIKPIKRSDFRNRFKRIINDYERNLKKLKVDLIDLTDNLCWEDTCHVLSPLGYSVYVDENHYGKLYSRHWNSAVDHLVEF